MIVAGLAVIAGGILAVILCFFTNSDDKCFVVAGIAIVLGFVLAAVGVCT